MTDEVKTGQAERFSEGYPERETRTDTRHAGLSFKGLKLSGFERQLITGNRCEAFLDMKCVFHPDSLDIYYNTDQYLRMDDVLRSGMTELDTALILCREFLDALTICEDYLLSPGDLSFRNENLFCTREITAVKFMYVPGCRNQMTIREKLIDIIDTVIEYDEGDDRKVSRLSDYKNKLYMSSQDLRSLTVLTEDVIRKCRSDQRISVQAAEQDKLSVSEHSPFRKTDSGKNSGLLQEEGVMYRENDEKKRDPQKIGRKLKHIFSELVS